MVLILRGNAHKEGGTAVSLLDSAPSAYRMTVDRHLSLSPNRRVSADAMISAELSVQAPFVGRPKLLGTAARLLMASAPLPSTC